MVRFACAYEATEISTTNALTLQPGQRRVSCVCIEAHDADMHIGAIREIIRLLGRPPVLGALGPIISTSRSRYANLLSGCLAA